MFLAARPRFSELARSYVWLEGVSTDVVRGRSSMSHGAPTGPGCHFWPCCLLSRRLLFNFGDDYQLATYTQRAAYWQKLDRESDRITVEEIGRTSEGRPHLMAIVTSPENHRNLAHYKEISRRLASVDGLSDAQARALAKEGKALLWIDGGLHASEVLGAQQLGEMVYR